MSAEAQPSFLDELVKICASRLLFFEALLHFRTLRVGSFHLQARSWWSLKSGGSVLQKCFSP